MSRFYLKDGTDIWTDKGQGSKALEKIFIYRLLVVKQYILSAANTAREVNSFLCELTNAKKDL